MQLHDWLWFGSIALGALNAWQNKSIQLAISELKLALIERIAKTEGDVRVLEAQSHGE